MKILVLSDSHSSLRFMRECVSKVQPDVIIHLGDHYDDGEALHEEFPNILFYQVPGNCDKYRAPIHAREILVMTIGGVRFYMTHGHIHKVKMVLSLLMRDARAAQADIALFGHTHQAYCEQHDGLWLMNPGSCSGFRPSYGWIIIDNNHVSCQIKYMDEWR